MRDVRHDESAESCSGARNLCPVPSLESPHSPTARVSAAYRDDYLTTLPGRNNNNVEGTAATMNYDFSSRWSVTDSLDLTLEALNLTDEFEDQWVDSRADRSSYYHHTGRQYFLGARYKF